MRFTKLHASIVASSIWGESPQTCKVWITMLAMADWDGVVAASVDGLAHLARVSIDECKAALATLSGPDEHSRDGTTGERIQKVAGGWLILNHNNYRDMRSPKQVRDAEYMKAYRARKESYSKECKSDTSISISSKKSGVSVEEREHEREETPKKPRKPRAPKPQPNMALFEEFFQAYAKKVARKDAEKAWIAHVGDNEELARKVIEAAEMFASFEEVKKQDRKYQPYPATWLNKERWNEEHLQEELARRKKHSSFGTEDDENINWDEPAF